MRTTESQDEDVDEEEEMMESDEYGGRERKMQMKLFVSNFSDCTSQSKPSANF
jgi:hypothetical protein